jgi:branched-chain amino acid transport system permease protein
MNSELFIRAILSGILMGAVYGVLGMGFSIVYGIVDLPIFTHGVFVMLGMYLLILLREQAGIGPYPGFIFLFLGAYLIGVLMYKFILKYILDIEHEMQLVFFLGLVIALSNITLMIFGPTSRLMTVEWLDKILFLGEVSLKMSTIIGAGCSILFVVLMEIFFKKTETGKAIRACGDNRKGAMYIGLNVGKMYSIAIGISLLCAAVAALAFVPLTPVQPELGFEYAVLAVLVAVLGGAGDMKGSLVAGFFMGLLLSLQQMFYDLSLSRTVLYSVMLVTLMLRPTGILGKGKSFLK